MTRGLARAVVPDAGLLLAAVTLVYALALLDGGRLFFRDSDSGWHIRTGESILDGRGLPRTDPYSFSKAGDPWFAWEWGADVLMGAVHRWDGLRGVVWLYALAIASSIWLWFRLHWTAGGDFLIGCVMLPLVLTTSSLHWLARPHVFGWLLMLLALLFAERPVRGWRGLALVFALGAGWANLHASFLLLPLVLALYGLKHGPSMLACAAAAMAGTLLNPYGIALHRHVITYLADSNLLDQIGEYQSFNFHAAGSWQILLAVMLAIAGAAWALVQRHFARCVWMLLVSVLALRSARALPLMALTALPFASAALRSALLATFAKFRAVALYSSRLRHHDRRFAGYALMPVFALCALGYVHAAPVGFPSAEFPVKAAASVAALPAQARILAPDKFGGYLIYRFEGARKVYFDGRSDFYGTAFLRDYVQLMQVRPGWESQLDRYRFTHALLPLNYSLAAVLPRAGWKTIYRDEVVVMLERP